MKSYILVHHRCEQDPRVVQVVNSLEGRGISYIFVGIDLNQNSFEQLAKNQKWIHLKPVRPTQLYRAWPPLREMIFKNCDGRILKSAILFLFACLLIPAIISLPLVFILVKLGRILKTKNIIKKTKGNRFILNRLRGFIAPLRFTFLFLKLFLTYHDFLKDKKDIAAIHCNDLETLLIGVYYKITRNLPLIYDAHEFFPYQASWIRGVSQKIFIQYEKTLISYSDYNFMVSQPLADLMKAQYKLKKDFYVVPNVFSVPKEDLSPVHRLEGPVQFHYAGGFLEERGLDFLIDSWKYIDTERSVLHLRGPRNDYYDSCVELARKNGQLNQSIFFHESIHEDELIQEARQFDVGIIPYLPISVNNKYCCPNKLCQYMFAANAILSNNLPNVGAFIRKYDNGIMYNSQDLETFVKAIAALTNLDRLNKMKENSLHWAQKDYNWEVQGKAFIAVYEEIFRTSTKI